MKFAPKSFKPKPEDIAWGVYNFGVTPQEVARQTELFVDHEFRRHYTDWDRCFRNWLRTADKHDLLEREHKHKEVEAVTEEQLEEDREKFKEDIKRLKLVRKI